MHEKEVVNGKGRVQLDLDYNFSFKFKTIELKFKTNLILIQRRSEVSINPLLGVRKIHAKTFLA